VVSISTCLPSELGEQELTSWRRLQREDSRLASPFLGPEFALALGRHRDDVRVAVIEESGQAVGFFAHQRGRRGVGRALGYGLGNAQGLVHAAAFEWRPRDLLARCGLAVWEFDNLVPHQVGAFDVRCAATAPAPFIDLSRGWDAWLESKRAAKVGIGKVQKSQRRLAREAGEVTFEFDTAARTDNLKLLMRLKSDQYRRTGRPDVFARPWVVAVVEDLADTATPDFTGLLSVLSVAGRPIAVRYSLGANNMLSAWFSSYEVDLGRYSPGLGSLLEYIRAGCERGYTEIDLAQGHYDYKEMIKDGDRAVAGGWVERPSAAATVRRLQQAPRRYVSDFVLSRPGLRQAVRRTRNRIGHLHNALRG
jgi:CelD/BcsL family acetyltransferase involved in cellulose biosynthesis